MLIRGAEMKIRVFFGCLCLLVSSGSFGMNKKLLNRDFPQSFFSVEGIDDDAAKDCLKKLIREEIAVDNQELLENFQITSIKLPILHTTITDRNYYFLGSDNKGIHYKGYIKAIVHSGAEKTACYLGNSIDFSGNLCRPDGCKNVTFVLQANLIIRSGKDDIKSDLGNDNRNYATKGYLVL